MLLFLIGVYESLHFIAHVLENFNLPKGAIYILKNNIMAANALKCYIAIENKKNSKTFLFLTFCS